MAFEQGNPKVNEKQYAFPIVKWKVSMNIIKAKEYPNGRCQGGPPLTPKPKPWEGEKGLEKNLKGKKNHRKKRLEKLDNVVDDETCHVAKKMPCRKKIWINKTQVQTFVHSCIILTNFLHKYHMNFTYEVTGDYIDNPTNYN